MHFTAYGEGEEVTSPTVERCFEAAVLEDKLWRLRGVRGGVGWFYSNFKMLYIRYQVKVRV
jgi:hypothetical protein